MKTRWKTLVVDDERLARARMRTLLRDCDGVEIIGEATNVSEAAEIVEKEQPDLIFLDVQMPGGDGLTLFEKVNVEAAVVLVTAHQQHAIRAFEAGAVDYLLKPVPPSRLEKTMNRLSKSAPLSKARSMTLNTADRISVIARGGGIEVVSVKEVTHIHGADDYSEVFLQTGQSRLSLRRLSEWEDRLSDHPFFRIHRSTIINTQRIIRIERRGKSHTAVLEGKWEPLSIARRRVKDLKNYMEPA